MSPILGIYASQISGHLFAPSGAYDSIATTTVGAGGASSITFSSIPNTYTHLQIRGIARDTTSGGGSSAVLIRFNSDTSTTYPRHYLYGDGSTVGAGFSTPVGESYAGSVALNGNTSGIFASNIIDILDYANTNKYKTLRSLSGLDTNASDGGIIVNSNLWQSTAAINTIRLSSATGNSFVQYSSFALYGIRGGN